MARVLVDQAVADRPGRRIIESIELRELAMNRSGDSNESPGLLISLEADPQSTLA